MNLDMLINEARAWDAERHERRRQEERARAAAERITRETAFRREFAHAFGEELEHIIGYELRHNESSFPYIWAMFEHRTICFRVFYAEYQGTRRWTVLRVHSRMQRDIDQVADRVTNRNMFLLTLASMLPPEDESPF